MGVMSSANPYSDKMAPLGASSGVVSGAAAAERLQIGECEASRCRLKMPAVPSAGSTDDVVEQDTGSYFGTDLVLVLTSIHAFGSRRLTSH